MYGATESYCASSAALHASKGNRAATAARAPARTVAAGKPSARRKARLSCDGRGGDLTRLRARQRVVRQRRDAAAARCDGGTRGWCC
eukprot:1000680-Prymnesium_polylepis.1